MGYSLRVKNVSIQSPEGFLHPGSGQSQIHADMGRPVEGTAVLPDNAHVPAHFQQFIQGHAMGSQPVGAVDKEHIGALGTEQGYAVEVIADIIHREIHISRDDLPKLVCPLTALRTVGADEGMNGQYVQIVLAGKLGGSAAFVKKRGVVNNVVAAD